MEYSLWITPSRVSIGLAALFAFSTRLCSTTTRKKLVFIHESFRNQRWPPSKHTYLVKVMLKTIFFTSLPLHHQRDRFPCERLLVKSPFIAVLYKRPKKVMNPIWRPTRSFEYPINSGFKRNKFKAETHNATNRGDLSRRHVASSARLLRQVACSLFVAAMSHEFKPVWIRATDRSDKILSQRRWFSHVTRGDLLQQPVAATCRSDLSHRVSRPLWLSPHKARINEHKRHW